MSDPKRELYISVDAETAGPTPSLYSLLSIGACTVFDPSDTFYIEIQPVNDAYIPEALEVSQLSLDELQENGLSPRVAMERVSDWITLVTPQDSQPVFVAFNAPFDWMFINDYFHRFLGYNPFGHKALDIKALYMGLHGISWKETGMDSISQRYLGEHHLTHHALQDALDQAEIFRSIVGEMKGNDK